MRPALRESGGALGTALLLAMAGCSASQQPGRSLATASREDPAGSETRPVRPVNPACAATLPAGTAADLNAAPPARSSASEAPGCWWCASTTWEPGVGRAGKESVCWSWRG
jgi:hypothetical protein